MRFVFDILGFQATWWASALGAGAGRWEPGAAVGAIVVVLQLSLARFRVATLATVFLAIILGIMSETAMIAAGLVQYSAAWPHPMFPPAWLIALWAVFATCIEATARMVGEGRLWKGALLGAALAPPTYWAGQSFGALYLAEPIWLPLATTGVVWALATPLLIATFDRTAR